MPKAPHGAAVLARQAQLLAYLHDHPHSTYEELAVGVGWRVTHKGLIFAMCDELITLGLVEKQHKGARALVVTRKGRRVVREQAAEIAE